jgi:hypothetical protein
MTRDGYACLHGLSSQSNKKITAHVWFESEHTGETVSSVVPMCRGLVGTDFETKEDAIRACQAFANRVIDSGELEKHGLKGHH